MAALAGGGCQGHTCWGTITLCILLPPFEAQVPRDPDSRAAALRRAGTPAGLPGSSHCRCPLGLLPTEVLRGAFSSVGFKVQCFLYLKVGDMVQILRQVASSPQHQHHDSFVCVLVSRGDPHRVFGVDLAHEGLPLEQVRTMFTGDACPPLIGKPKLFFIQSYLVSEAPLGASSLPEVDGPAVTSVESTKPWPQPHELHREADILWSHCTAQACLLELPEASQSLYLQGLSQQLLQDR